MAEGRRLTPAISIVVPIHNAEPYLRGFLQSLNNSRFRDFELIIVDDKSIDRGPEIAQESPLVSLLIQLPENRGKAYAVNAGMRASVGDYVVVSDPDLTIDPTLLAIWSQEMKANEDAGVLGAFVYYRDSPSRLTHSGAVCRLFPVRVSRLNKNTIDTGQSQHTIVAPRLVLDDIYMVRRTAIDRAGPFDDVNFPMMLEDADLQWRIESSGYKNRVVAGARAFHDEPVDGSIPSTHYTLRKMCLISENRLVLFRRHLSVRTPNLLISAVGAFALYCGMSVVRFGFREAFLKAFPALTKATVRGLTKRI